MADSEPETTSNIQPEETKVPSGPPIDSIKAQKMARIQAHIDALNAEIKAKSEKLEAVKAELKSPNASLTVKTHIALLHQYNEIRDIGQGLIGLVAEQRNCRVAHLYAGSGEGGSGGGEFGVGVRD